MQGAYVVKKSEVTERRNTLEEALRILDATIEQSESSIKIMNARIRQKDLRSQELSQNMIDTSKKIYIYRQTILSYLANIYAEGNMVQGNDGEIDIIK